MTDILKITSEIIQAVYKWNKCVITSWYLCKGFHRPSDKNYTQWVYLLNTVWSGWQDPEHTHTVWFRVFLYQLNFWDLTLEFNFLFPVIIVRTLSLSKS